MSAEDTFKFGFDTKAFEEGVKRVTGSLGGIQGNMKKSFDPKTVGNFTSMAVAKFAIIGTLIKGAMGMLTNGLKSAVQGIPEIGQTFKIAGDIIQKNLLWPLRQMLIPLLQKMLDWVRDHRTTFIKWGAVVANVFRTIIAIAKVLWSVLKMIGDSIKKALTGSFGEFNVNIEKAMNVLLFKITVVVEYLKILLGNLIDYFQPILDMIVKIGKAFGTGWLDGFKQVFDLEEALGGLKDAFGGVFDALKKLLGLGSDEKGLSFFKSLGTILGAGFAANLQLMAVAIEGMLKPLENLINLISHLINVARGMEDIDWSKLNLFEGTGDIAEKGVGVLKRAGKSMLGAMGFGGDEKNVKDAIITPSGRIITPAADDTIIATKTPVSRLSASSGGKGGGPMSVNISHNIRGTLQVTEGSAEKAGQNFVRGVGKQVYDELMGQIVMEGGF